MYDIIFKRVEMKLLELLLENSKPVPLCEVKKYKEKNELRDLTPDEFVEMITDHLYEHIFSEFNLNPHDRSDDDEVISIDVGLKED